VVITGEDLPKYLPKNSEVEVTIEVNKGRRITFKAYFPDIDETIERVLEAAVQSEYDADIMNDEIEKSKKTLSILEDESPTIDLSEAKKIRSELEELNEILSNGRTDYGTIKACVKRFR
jgi:hypothetical protein